MHLASDTLTIPAWANGPDGSGNGGWTAGLLARHVDAPGVSVSLRVPPPIGRALQVVHGDSDVQLRDGDVLVAQAEPAAIEFDVPDRVCAIAPDEAHHASAGFPFRDRHPFPRCLVCGTARASELPAFHLHCGPLAGARIDGAQVFADRWLPDADLADPENPTLVASEAAWAALDCPSASPVADPEGAPVVLARIAAHVRQRPRVSAPHVLAAWHVSTDGRKHVTRSTLIDEDGRLLAAAEALWIEVRPR